MELMTSVSSFFTIALIVILVICAVLGALILISKKLRDSKDSTSEDAWQSIQDLRKSRYSLAYGLLSSFPAFIQPSDYAQAMGMLSQYPKISDEQVEIQWETAWLPIMRRVCDSLIASPSEAAHSSVAAFSANEQKLTEARESREDGARFLGKFGSNKIVNAAPAALDGLGSVVSKVQGLADDAKAKGTQDNGEAGR